MKRLSSCFVSVLALMFLYSCTGSPDDIRTLKVDIPESGIAVLNLDEYDRIELSEEVPLQDIGDVIPFKGGYVVHSREDVMYFSEEGEFISRVGFVGRGPGEYIRPSSVYAVGDTVCIYSQIGGNDIYRYHFSDGKFSYAYTEHIDSFFAQKVIEAAEFPGLFFVHNSCAPGTDGSMPVLVVYDSDMQVIASSSSYAVMGGKSSNYNMCDGKLYYSSFGRDTVWAYDGNDVIPAFRYDFGRAGISKDGILEKLSYMNTHPELFFLFHEGSIVTERYVFALMRSQVPLLVVYDLDEDMAMLYRPVFGNGEEAYIQCMLTGSDGSLMIAVRPQEDSRNQNPILYRKIF